MLALEGVSTQYMWTTWRKQPAGWLDEQQARAFEAQSAKPADEQAMDAQTPARIRRITNASSSEPVAPCRGRFASISIWVENLPADAGLHHLRVTVGDSFGTVRLYRSAGQPGIAAGERDSARARSHRVAAGSRFSGSSRTSLRPRRCA